MDSVKKQIDVSWRTLNDLDRRIFSQFPSGIVNLIYKKVEDKLVFITDEVNASILNPIEE